MPNEFPQPIEDCIRNAARRFGRSLAVLNWPNGGKDAPPNEANVIINLSYFLAGLEPEFDLYAEGAVNQNCRVDLIGFDGVTAIAVEAKVFGDVNKKSVEVLSDLRRLTEFRPSLSEVKNNAEAQEWWDSAKHRWAIIIIASFRGKEIADAWLSGDETVAKERMSTYSASQRATDAEGGALGFLSLMREVPFEHRRAERITSGQQWGSGEGWLLWAAIPLPQVGSSGQSAHFVVP